MTQAKESKNRERDSLAGFSGCGGIDLAESSEGHSAAFCGDFQEGPSLGDILREALAKQEQERRARAAQWLRELDFELACALAGRSSAEGTHH